MNLKDLPETPGLYIPEGAVARLAESIGVALMRGRDREGLYVYVPISPPALLEAARGALAAALNGEVEIHVIKGEAGE